MVFKKQPVLLLAFCLLTTSPSLSGQSTEIGKTSIVPVANDVFLLTPAAPSVTRPIVIDAAPQASIRLSAFSQQLAVTLVSPNGVRYVFGDLETPAFESVITVHEPGGGANYTAILHNPAPGTWQLQVSHPAALSKEVDVFVTVIVASPVAVTLLASDNEYPVGAEITLALAAIDGRSRLPSVAIVAGVVRPDGTTQPLAFRDNGAGYDHAAGDGIHTATLALPAAGRYDIAADVTGSASTGAFKRTAHLTLEAFPQTARFDGTFTDTPVDEDGDGFFDEIRIAPRLNVQLGGPHTLSVTLVAANGKSLQRAITVPLEAGSRSPAVSFRSSDIVRDLAADGAYSVGSAEIDRRQPDDDAVPVDRRRDLGSTRAYRLSDFVPQRLRLTGRGTAAGRDTNGNGRYDFLDVHLGIVTEVAGQFDFTATLLTTSGREIGSASGSASLSGEGTIALAFAGTQIGQNAESGPYTVSLTVRGAGLSIVAPRAFETSAIPASTFEGFPMDTDTCERLAIERVRDQIRGDLADPATPAAGLDKLEDVIEKLDTFFTEWNKQPPAFIAALGVLEGVVGDLESAVKDGLIAAAKGRHHVDAVAGTAERLAARAIRTAAADPAVDAGELAKAKSRFTEGQSYRSQGAGKDAVARFKDAVANAESAAQTRMTGC